MDSTTQNVNKEQNLKSLFDHPKQVCMNYFQHMRLSLYFSYLLACGSFNAFIHAFYPDILITSTSDLSIKLKNILDTSGCNKSE